MASFKIAMHIPAGHGIWNRLLPVIKRAKHVKICGAGPALGKDETVQALKSWGPAVGLT